MTVYAHKAGVTSAEAFWYVLGCICFGAAYLAKVPVKKAMSELGLCELTSAESFWYVLGCICFGAAYFKKVPVAKALSELDQFTAIRATSSVPLERPTLTELPASSETTDPAGP